MLHRVEGIVIRSIDYGEGNKIIHVFTPTMGKLSVMARGAKKFKSRHTAVTQMFTHGDFVIYKSAQMGTLNSGEIIESHSRLRDDLHMTAYASYIAEMVDRTLGEEDISVALFEQFKAALSAIEQQKDAQIISHIFEMKMLALSGYLPDLEDCVSCGKPAGGSVLFSTRFGGLLCESCRHQDPAAFPVLERALELLRMFRQMDLTRLGTITVQSRTKEHIKQCMRGLMNLHMDIQWKSRNFIDQMDKYGI